jgi:hypothetical protein
VLISEWNLRALFYELYHGARYPLPLSNFDDTGALLATGDDDVPEPSPSTTTATTTTTTTTTPNATATSTLSTATENKTPAKVASTHTPKENKDATPTTSTSMVMDTSRWPTFRVHILNDDIKKMTGRSRYDKLFNRVFFSQFHVITHPSIPFSNLILLDGWMPTGW